MVRDAVLPQYLRLCLLFVGATAVRWRAATRRPDPVLNAVKNGPHAKIGPWLSNLYEEYQEASGRGRDGEGVQDEEQGAALGQGNGRHRCLRERRAALARVSLRALGATKVKARGPLGCLRRCR